MPTHHALILIFGISSLAFSITLLIWGHLEETKMKRKENEIEEVPKWFENYLIAEEMANMGRIDGLSGREEYLAKLTIAKERAKDEIQSIL